jgi:protein SFI1
LLEIETLYDIVRHAQTLPGPPFRALFKAYDEIKARKKENDDESRYFTFLLRMQEDRDDEDEGLVDRFQKVLAKMGILVELDPEGEGVEVTTNLDDLGSGRVSTQNSLGRKSRRGSFDSFFDGVADKVAGTEYGELPYRSRRGSLVASDVGDKRHKKRSNSDSGARAQIHGQIPIRGRSGYTNRRSASEGIASRPRRSGSVSSRGSLRIYRDGYTGTQQLTDYDDDESVHTDSFDRSHIQIPGVNAPLPGQDYDEKEEYEVPRILYKPSDTQFGRDAETFDYNRILALRRTCIHKWRARTRASVEQCEQMEAKAIAFDRNILFRASLDFWRVALQIRQQTVETDRFFERLERRAGKARNLFLLTKAFTHWAKSAEDEVQRTSTARRHILRTRYFNAWRDITAVNELKIQHFVLRKFLDKWRNRTAAVFEQNDLAVGLHEHNIVYKTYWQWFWTFADLRAPGLHKDRIARETIRKWAEIVTILKEREAWAKTLRDRATMRRALGNLRERVARVRALEAEAHEFRGSVVISSAFYALRRQTKLVPLEGAVRSQVDFRLVRSSFQVWHRDTQLSRQAREVDQKRVMRNAFTAWNDRLRIQALSDRIDDRLQLECLYKWALASRVSLFQRVHNHRLKASILSTWAAKTRNQEYTLEDVEARFASYKRPQLLRAYLRKIEDATAERKNKEYLALSVYEPKLKQHALTKLVEKHDHLQQLDNWADRANYYVTTKSSINKWQKATEFARRNRRRAAYTHMRRTVKINLVKRMFGIWREKTERFAIAGRQADEMTENKVLWTSTALVERWRQRTYALRNLQAQATRHYKTHITGSTLAAWSQKFHVLQTLENQALALRQESTEIAASGCLKKLGWRLWNVQRQEDNALALHQRNFEKHLRAMIRFWWEQTSERLVQRPVSPSPSSRHRRSRSDDNDEGGRSGEDIDAYGEEDQGAIEENNDGDETKRLEAWTAFDENALGLSNTTLDLSFTVSPQRWSSNTPALPPPQRPYTQPPPSAHRFQPPPPSSAYRPTASLMRPAPAAIPEIPDLEDEEEEPGFWTSTPAPMLKPGYLKTPSKRSVARAKRPELPASPEKSTARAGIGIDRQVGAASAPPVPGYIDRGVGRGVGGITSFEKRLREGGFSSSVAGRGRIASGRGKGNVVFE